MMSSEIANPKSEIRDTNGARRSSVSNDDNISVISNSDFGVRVSDLMNASCPLPISDHKEIVLAHGSGGKLTHRLIERMILPAFANPLLEPLHDGAVFSVNGAKLAFSTDSYVVKPIFFPGGYRQTGRSRHGQRSGHVRRAAAASFGSVHHRGRISNAGFVARVAVHARGG
jgi:hypothetical protein